MEILSLLRLNGRRFVALSALGAITGGLAASAVQKQPASYEANVTVFVSQALPAGGSSFDIGPLVSDFQEALRLPQVRRAAADALALPLDDVVVTATRNGTDGGSVRVTSIAATPEGAETLASTLSAAAMRALGQQQVDRANALETQRSTEVTTARATRDKLLADNGFVDPGATYNDIADEANRLALAAADPTVQLTAEARAGATTEAARLRSQLPVLRAKAEEYRLAQKKLEVAEDNLTAANKERVAAEATLASATSERVISESDTVTVSPVAKMVQGAAAAVVATFAAGVAFFAGVEALRNRARRRRPARPAPQAKGAALASNAPVPPVLEHDVVNLLAEEIGREPVEPAEPPERASAGASLVEAATSSPEVPEPEFAEDRARPDRRRTTELVEVGAGRRAVANGDSWANPRSMFSKPARPLAGAEARAESRSDSGGAVAVTDPPQDTTLADETGSEDQGGGPAAVNGTRGAKSAGATGDPHTTDRKVGNSRRKRRS